MRFQSSLRKLGHLAIQSSYTREATIGGSRVSAAFLRRDFTTQVTTATIWSVSFLYITFLASIYNWVYNLWPTIPNANSLSLLSKLSKILLQLKSAKPKFQPHPSHKHLPPRILPQQMSCLCAYYHAGFYGQSILPISVLPCKNALLKPPWINSDYITSSSSSLVISPRRLIICIYNIIIALSKCI